MVNYYNQVTPLVGTVVNTNTYSQPTYYQPPANNSYYQPSYQMYPSYAYVPSYQQPGYQQPTYQTTPTTPTKSTSTTPTTVQSPPVIQGKNISYQKVSDLGAIGDTKTVQMPDGSYRNYTRTGTNTYQYTEIRSADRAVVTAIGSSSGDVQVTKVSPSANTPVSKPLVSQPLILYQSSGGKSISNTSLSNVGDMDYVDLPSGGYVTYIRTSPTQIQYREYDSNNNIVKPLTPIYEETPTIALAAKLTPTATTSTAANAAPTVALAAKRTSTATTPPAAKADKPSLGSLVKSDSLLVVQSAVDPAGEGEGSSSDDESLEEPANTYEQFSTTHPGAIDVVENGTGKILRSYYPDTGKDVTEFDETFAGVDKSKLLIPEQIDVDRMAENAVDDAVKQMSDGSIPDPVSKQSEIPSTTSPLISPSVDPTQISVSGEALPFNYVKPDGFEDDTPAQNAEQLNYVYAEALSKYNPSGNKNGDNAAISEHFSGIVPTIIQGEIDPHKLASIIHKYEDYRDGSVSSSHKVYVPGKGYVGELVQNPFNELSLEDQKKAIQDLIESSAREELPIGYALPLINELINTVDREERKRDLNSYVKNGGLEKDLRAFGKGSPIAKMMGWATSDEGLLSIGAAFGVASTVAAFIAGGPIAGIGALGMSEFQATEFKQNMGSNLFIDNAKLANKNLKSSDRFQAYNRMFSTTNDAVNDYGRYYKDYDEATRKQKLDEIKKAVKDQGTLLRQETVFLSDLNIYPSELNRWNSLNDSINNYEKLVDPVTGVLTGLKSVPAILRIKPPEGGKVVGPDFVHGSDSFYDITMKDQGTTSVKIYDKNDNLVKTEEISYYPGNVINKDYSNLLAYESTKGGSGTDKVVTGKTTVYLPPGVSFNYEGKTYTGGQGGTTYDIKRQAGAPLRLEFTAPGKKPLTEYIGFPETGWNSYAAPADLKGDLSEPDNFEGFIVPLYEGQKIYINGLEANKYISEDNYLAVPYGAGKYDVRIVNPDGSTAYHNPDEYVSDGKMTALPLTMGEDPKQPYQKQSYGGYSGGGGGGSSGGGGGGSSYAPQPEPETLIIYGPTCKDAELWQDEVQVYPEIDEPYSISPGYHSIKAQRSGFKIWLKTVYCASGDSITVSPAFEPLDTSSEPTEPVDSTFPKRVFVNSDPSGGLVLVNGSSSGEWTPCYLDLPEGYYTFTIKKSGYDPYDIVCYVGEVIAWNQQAVELATSRKWI